MLSWRKDRPTVGYCSGVVEGDKMSGAVEFEVLVGDWSAARVPEN